MTCGRIFLLLSLTTLLHYTETKALISRCLTKRREHIFMSCPHDHVIYKPEVFLGVSGKSDCTHQDGDCIGLSMNLMKQKNKCFWQKLCSYGWRFNDIIVKSANSSCFGKEANYVAYTNPLCIHKDQVFNVCDNNAEPIITTNGVLRSHQEYPWAYGTMMGSCTRKIQIRQGYRLKLTIEDVETHHGDHLLIQRKTDTSESNSVVFNGTSSLEMIYTINEGIVEVKFMASPGAKIGRGFLIRFEQVVFRPSLEVIQLSVKDTVSNNTEEFAAIEECLNHKNKYIKLSCPDGHVIYKPGVKVGSSNYDRCYSSHGDCKGRVHTILTQENNCYWSQNCDISWSGRIPITMTSSSFCLAMMPTYSSMSNFQCIREDSVFDICDRTVWEVNVPTGIIKSHEKYPWNYRTETRTCRKRIRVPRESGLRLYTDDFDLDLDTRKERMNIWHVSPTGVRSKLRKLRGVGKAEVVVGDGCIDVEFKVVNSSKSGRGFILKIENFLSNIEAGDTEDVYDCGGKATFFPKKSKRKGQGRRKSVNGQRNKQLKSKRNRKHRKGKRVKKRDRRRRN